jgi:hypothetical protein
MQINHFATVIKGFLIVEDLNNIGLTDDGAAVPGLQ